MKRTPNWMTRVAAKLPGNDYKFNNYSVDILKHRGRKMTPVETNFLSCVQRTPLPGLALLLILYEANAHKLELIRIAMRFHIYRDDFELYLNINKSDPRVKKAMDIWASLKAEQHTTKV